MSNMLRNKPDKKISDFQLSFDNILVCNEKKLRPFMEIIVQDPENIEQQNLGTLIGIFEISDTSEDSSYIVNYLISIIKKEYFSKPRRGAVESFEAALHKANLALSKLAEHGNINWIGKINVLCAVIEKNRLHLAQVGTAAVFLLRSKTLTNISENSEEENLEPNPLKTFNSVSSGKMEAGDKLLIVTESIFDIFSFEEIKKSALRFSAPEFVQFLRTALGNQLDKAVALVIDLKEKAKEPEEHHHSSPDKYLNAFSQEAFKKTAKKPANSHIQIENELQVELKKSKNEFTDKKTGHIYIKEDANPTPEKDYFFGLKSFLQDCSLLFSEIAGKLWKKLTVALKNSFGSFKQKTSEIKLTSAKEKMRRSALSLKESLFLLFKNYRLSRKSTANEITKKNVLNVPDSKLNFRLSWLPSFSKLKSSLTALSYEQKLYALLIVLAIITVPYFGLQISKKMAEKKTPIVEEAPPVILPLEQDKNVVRLDSLVSAHSGNGILKTINLNGKFFTISESEIAALESGEKFVVPEDFGRIFMATGMRDLDLIFLLNPEGKTVSFSPVSKKFQNNTLAIPDGIAITDAKTYL
ncbi:MAG: hypothetical protein CO141_03590, partial [Candidatus Moranbacteria bacterium CG_4_9_14_3_um_filter_42_9]